MTSFSTEASQPKETPLELMRQFHSKDLVTKPKGWPLQKPMAHAQYRRGKQTERGRD